MNNAHDTITDLTPLPRQRRTPEQQLAAAQALANKAKARIAERHKKLAGVRTRMAGEWLLKRAETDERARALLAELKASKMTPAQAEAFAG